ncbi:MAG: substrate-binding domain-containing protein [Flavobacteriaceae bacterium]|nr:substrate-binding domain-containing protein [Flavobacteriaceae bacterium]MDZ4148227.1 substrate-binding domain-containing protein [Flavobacteriaceae bacterium]
MKTIKDIAEEAQVSPGTVDRVLHNRGGVSKKTEEKVRQLLKKNNFKINRVARSLAMNKYLKIATLIPEYNTENIFWRAPRLGIQSAQEEVAVFGVKVTNFTFDQFRASSYVKQFNALLNANPDGVVIVPTFQKETKQLTIELEKRTIPYIFINIDLEGFNNLSFIGQDAYLSGRLAAKLMHLCLKDACDVLIVQTRSNIDINHAISKRISGFTDYLSENKIQIKCIKVDVSNLDDSKALTEEIRMVLNKNPNIKGVFVPNSRIALFADCIEKRKTRKLTLIGYDGTDPNIQCLKEDTVEFLISQKPFKQGYNSIKLMTDFLIDKKHPEAKIYSPIEILTKENILQREVNSNE